MNETTTHTTMSLDDAKRYAEDRGIFGTLAGRSLAFYRLADRFNPDAKPLGLLPLDAKNRVDSLKLQKICK